MSNISSASELLFTFSYGGVQVYDTVIIPKFVWCDTNRQVKLKYTDENVVTIDYVSTTKIKAESWVTTSGFIVYVYMR